MGDRRRADRARRESAGPRPSSGSPRATTSSGSRSRPRSPVRRRRGGPRSRPSPTRSRASNASTRAAGSCCRGRSRWPPERAGRSSSPTRSPWLATGRSTRDASAARRPRPLLPAVADRPRDGPRPHRPDRRPGARLERADRRRLLPTERRARQPGSDLVGPRTDPRRLPGGRRSGRLSRLRRRRRWRQRPRAALPPHHPAARHDRGSADRDPLGPARLRAPVRATTDRCLAPGDGGRSPDAAPARRRGRHPHDPGAVAADGPRPGHAPGVSRRTRRWALDRRGRL